MTKITHKKPALLFKDLHPGEEFTLPKDSSTSFIKRFGISAAVVVRPGEHYTAGESLYFAENAEVLRGDDAPSMKVPFERLKPGAFFICDWEQVDNGHPNTVCVKNSHYQTTSGVEPPYFVLGGPHEFLWCNSKIDPGMMCTPVEAMELTLKG